MVTAFLATILFSVSVIAASRSIKLLGGNAANFGRVAVAIGWHPSQWATSYFSWLGAPSSSQE